MTTMTAAWKRIRIALFAAVALVAWTGTRSRRSSRRSKTSEAGDPAGRFVSIAYGIIWLAVLAYVVMVAAGLKRVNQEIADVKRKRIGPRASDVTALAISLPPSSHFIYIPVVLVIGIVVGFMLGAKATRDEIALGQKKAAEREARMAERAARRAAASSDTAK
jgi:CcmD family protein